MRTYRLSLFFVLLLAACTPDFSPEQLNFEDDPRILRGEWAGEVASASVVPLAYSPDGSQLFVEEGPGAAIYDAQTFEVVARLELTEDEFADTAQFSLDGETLATTTRETSYEGPVEVSLWDTRTGERLDTASFTEDAMRFSEDLARLATLSYQAQTNEVHIWDVSSEQRLNTFTLPDYNDILVSPDLTKVAAFGWEEGRYVAALWDLKTQAQLLEFRVASEDFISQALLFSPDSTLLAIARGEDELSTVQIWNITTNQFLPSPNTKVRDLITFDAESKVLVTQPDCDRCIHIWDAQTGTKLREVELRALGDLGSFDYGLLLNSQLEQVAWLGPESQLLVSDLNSGDILTEVSPKEPLDIQLSLEAIYVDEGSYNVSGTLQYDAERYTVQGRVLGGGDQSYIRPTTSPLPGASFDMEASDAKGDVRWLLSGFPPPRALYDGEELDLNENAFEGRIKSGAARAPSLPFFLERQP